MTESTATVATTATAPKAPTLDTIEKQYFAPAELDKAQIALSNVLEIASANNTDPIRNFDPEAEFPEGYGLLIFPINERNTDGSGNSTIGVAIGAIPDPELIANTEGGADFIRNVLLDSCIRKLGNAVRPRKATGDIAASIPFSVSDFITSTRAGESLATFRTLAPRYVKGLKKKGISFMTNKLLQSVFQSAAYAESQFPTVPQVQWLGLIDSMIGLATAEGKDTAILENWKATRDQVETVTADIDLSDFDELIADNPEAAEAEETAEAEEEETES